MSKDKYLFFISVILIFLFGLAVGKSFFYKIEIVKDGGDLSECRYKTQILDEKLTSCQQKYENLSSIKRDKPRDVLIAPSDVKEGWLDYKNESLNFEISFPKNLRVTDTTQSEGESGISMFFQIEDGENSARIHIDPAGWGGPYVDLRYDLQKGEDGYLFVSQEIKNDATGFNGQEILPLEERKKMLVAQYNQTEGHDLFLISEYENVDNWEILLKEILSTINI
ncbi:hypothetical protein C0581_02780 [Candidatus Parcubacteria bacterium]|nr:MAG: hypothetical protein C0581_02780 [Candidatus Parcubacteria bacterium]